jgi:hypothetical protein
MRGRSTTLDNSSVRILDASADALNREMEDALTFQGDV